jgi:bacteriorhodopsin
MIELCLLTGASFRLIFLEAVISFSAIVATLISALIPSSYKWAYL